MADNAWFEERVSPARLVVFEDLVKAPDAPAGFYERQAWYWKRFVRALSPHTFLADLEPAAPDWPDALRDPDLYGAIRYGRLRRLRFRAGSADSAARQAALDDVQATLRDDPAFAYAGALAARFDLPGAADALPSFAVAFEQALAQKDWQRLKALAKEQPRLQALILVALALLGDKAAAWQVDALLKAPADRYEARPVMILRSGLGLVLAAANDAPVPQAIALHRDAVRRRLYDANEVAFGDRIAA